VVQKRGPPVVFDFCGIAGRHVAIPLGETLQGCGQSCPTADHIDDLLVIWIYDQQFSVQQARKKNVPLKTVHVFDDRIRSPSDAMRPRCFVAGVLQKINRPNRTP